MRARARRTTVFRLFSIAAGTALVAGTAVAVTMAPASAATLATVAATPAQTIQNFGASGAWWVNDLTNFSTANQQRVAQLLFSSSGIQLSAYRYNIGGGGVGVRAGDRAPQTPLVSPGVYDWSRDPGGTTFLRYAAQNGVPDLIAFANSAPAVWKDNNKSCGGHVRAGSEGAFATYLTDVVTHFNAEGVRLNYVSPFNEPDNSFDGNPCSQEGMLVATSQRDDIVRALGAQLASRASFSRISADESSQVAQFLGEVPQWINQSGTAGYVANLSHHTYDFPSDAARGNVAALGRQLGKPTWSSEICCFTGINGGYGAQYDPTITGALAMTSIIHRDLTVANDSAFHWWTALSKVIGCNPGTTPACANQINTTGYNDGLIYYDPNYASNGNQSLYLTKRYYAMGQYSKFVRPGSVRYPVTGAPANVQIMATSQGGNWTLVINNLNTTTQDVDVRFGTNLTALSATRTSASESLASIGLPSVSGPTAMLSLPARSISTYVFRQGTTVTNPPTTAPPTSNGALIGQASNKCLDVPGQATANGTRLSIYTCNGGANQQWAYTAAAELRVYGNKCLNPVGGGTTAGTATEINDCTGTPSQKWSFNPNATISNQQSGLCLDVNGASTANGAAVILWTCTAATNQQWHR